MSADIAWSTSEEPIAGCGMHLMRAGTGAPVLVLHHDIGTLDRTPFYDALAGSFDTLVPHHPGYSRSERPDWMRSARDVAVCHRWLLSRLGIEKISLVGLGFGGWIAAEMATMAPSSVDKLVLVGAMGVKPSEGFIMDQALWNHLEYTKAGFHDMAAYAKAFGEEPPTDLVVEWEICREMNFRIAWKPYMYSQTLPHLLGAVEAPALVVWGDDDRIVPMNAGDIYVENLPNAQMEVVSNCGHYVDLEKPAELAKRVTDFIAG
jgi:pimeloyl-ACP methyl ester carboxylesterase